MSTSKMKIYIPSVLTGADIACFTEVFSIIPFISQHESYQLIADAAGYWNDGLYTNLYLNEPKNITRVIEIHLADVVFIPFKYNKDDERIVTICNEAASYRKIVFVFYNDDNGEVFDLPHNLYLFRTSTTTSTITDKERILPVLIPDHKPCTLQLTDNRVNDNIGFCGHNEGIREYIIDTMNTLADKRFNPIIRNGFWAHGMNKIQARREYYANLADNQYTLCIRGCGNFSYRFYEALSFGRIPIVINTDMILPLYGHIKWSDHIIDIPFDIFSTLSKHEFEFLVLRNPISPLKNRQLWEKYFSPEGYLDNSLPYEITNMLYTES